jgi:hypothetical protein
MGEVVDDIIPAELLERVRGATGKADENFTYTREDGRQVKCWRCPMGETSASKGVVLVVDADI